MTVLPASVSRRTIGLFGVVVAALLALGPQAAHGQLWLQTSRVVTPVEQGPIRTFLDSLVTVMDRRGIKVRRSPERDSTMTVTALRNRLIDEERIGINGANHAFIDYRFSIDSGGQFRQQISKIHFVFRPGPGQSDISVLYLDAQQAWVDQFLRGKGTTLTTNEAAFIPFLRHLDFAQVARQEETRVVEIGGKTVREGFQEEKEDLIRKVERLTYESFV
jgi:hypothetical protein